MLVPKVEFVSAPGTSPANVYRPGGPYALVTGRCVFRFERARGRFRLESVHPGHTVDEVVAHTGFDFDLPEAVPETPAPSAEDARADPRPGRQRDRRDLPALCRRGARDRPAVGPRPPRREAGVSTAPATDVIPEIEPVADAEVRAIVEHAIERYIAARHERVAAFVDRHFGLIGALRLHRHALGLDLLRAPANVLLVVPYLSMQLGGGGPAPARRATCRAPAEQPHACSSTPTSRAS